MQMKPYEPDLLKNDPMKTFASATIWHAIPLNKIHSKKDTRKFLGKSLETRILEKVNGEWKIAYLSFRYYPLEVKQE